MVEQYNLYNGTPPHSNDNTSREAAESMRPHVSKLAERVLTYIASRWNGATEWEASQALGMLHQTCSARCRELKLRGLVVWNGEKRKTGTGRNAQVLVRVFF